VARPAPTAGMHYPRSLGEFSSWFGTDADCLDYLEWLRRPDGFLLRGDSQHAMNHTVSGVQKVLVAIAVERFEPKGLGRCRMAWMLDGSSASLRAFLIDHVQQGATVISDGWQPYRPATKELYVHDRVVVPGAKASDLLPGVHRIASLAQRWLLGTHQGAVEEPHLSSYLDEFVFRFNRRRSRSRGMVFYRVLELAVAHDPVRYRDLILNPRPSITHRVAPATRGRPQSLDRASADRPWRSANAPSSG
jgi:ISXO2-like transposase domain